MRIFFYGLLLFFPLLSSAQISSDSLPERVMYESWMYRTENSWGVVPTVTLANFSSVGVSLAKGYFEMGEYGGFSRVISVGTEYFPDRDILKIEAAGLLHAYTVIGGVNTRLSAEYFHHKNQSTWAIRPQIGLGLLKGFIHYGYSFYIENSLHRMPKHSVTFSFYITVLEINKRFKNE